MNNKPLLDYIKKYINLTLEEEILLLSKINIRTYLKNQYIVQQGDVCKSVNFIITGCTKTFYMDTEGQEHIVMFSIEDWWASEIGSFVTQSPSNYHVQCIEDTELVQISFLDQEELFIKIPKLERFFRLILEQAFVASQKRIITSFSLTAKEQYLNFKTQYPKLEERIPQYMVASYLGFSREFLSRIKKQLASHK